MAFNQNDISSMISGAVQDIRDLGFIIADKEYTTEELKKVLCEIEQKSDYDLREFTEKLEALSRLRTYIENNNNDFQCNSHGKDYENGYVYLVVGENGKYKIGVSKNPSKRISELKLNSCENHRFEFYQKVKSPYDVEAKLHDHFKQKRSHSEWFSLDKEDVLKIKRYLLKVGQNEQ